MTQEDLDLIEAILNEALKSIQEKIDRLTEAADRFNKQQSNGLGDK